MMHVHSASRIENMELLFLTEKEAEMPKNPGQIHEFQVPCANKRHAPDHQTSKAKKAQLLRKYPARC